MDPGHFRMGVLAAVIATFGGLTLWALFRVLRRKQRPLTPVDRVIASGSVAGLVIGVACFGWAHLEADWLSETHLEVHTKKLAPGKRLRIVHLTDLHVDHARPLYDEVQQRVNALRPDLIVFTGDSLNAAEGLAPFRALMSGLVAPLGRFAVRGNHDTSIWYDFDLFGGGVATELKGTPIALPTENVAVCGTRYDAAVRLIECTAAADPSRFVIAAYHTPDLIERVQPHAPDLYLGGHTHGGQVRVPFYGAVITLSAFDKKYEMGRYAVGPTTLFVSRGVGVEPHAPRIRFLCRPEIAVIDVVGD